MCGGSRVATVHHRIYIMRGRKAKSLGSLHYAFTHGQTCASAVNGVLWARRIHRRASGIFLLGGQRAFLVRALVENNTAIARPSLVLGHGT